MLEHMRAVPGDFGAEFITFTLGPFGGANNLGGITPLTASGTTKFPTCATGNQQIIPVRLSARATTIPISAAATLLCRVVRYVAATTSEQIITQNIDITTLVTRQTLYQQNLLAGITDAQRTLIPGDGLEVHCVSNGAIGTQPVELMFTVLCKVLKSKGS